MKPLQFTTDKNNYFSGLNKTLSNHQTTDCVITIINLYLSILNNNTTISMPR